MHSAICLSCLHIGDATFIVLKGEAIGHAVSIYVFRKKERKQQVLNIAVL